MKSLSSHFYPLGRHPTCGGVDDGTLGLPNITGLELSYYSLKLLPEWNTSDIGSIPSYGLY